MRIAAVDQGSSATKGALFDERGVVLARAQAAVGTQHDGVHVTHDPAELLASVRHVLAELAGAGRPDAVALACQRSTCLLWERATGKPLTAAPWIAYVQKKFGALYGLNQAVRN